jgi:hypothetical protein
MTRQKRPDSEGLNDLLAIFNMRRKADLKAHCRNAVITRGDLANHIFACMTYSVPIIHARTHRHHHPAHLWPSDDEHAALGQAEPGPVTGEAAKFLRKIGQLTEERRLFNAHYFQPVHHPGDWHLFYWDQRDTHGDHWQHGSHIHLVNMVTHPKLTLEALSDELAKPRPRFSGGLHIRFERED